MSDIVIRVENLSKRYTIRHQNGRGDGLRHVIHDAATAPLRWLRGGVGSWVSGNGSSPESPIPKTQYPTPNTQHPTEEFWALRGVSFEVKQGEVLGIIGRNGAGKTTLLKVLSRITEPTEGRVRIRGRVASLLEVGTGFHPELTGRENIFVNGAILGMTRAEVQKKFDEIVDFSGVEKFIDTPVKRYSSGMYVRLAFAVAAHLEPEILIVDEVLAVGDFEFQNRCLGKMNEVAKSGRTVLFVSHNIGAVGSLCERSIVLADGRLAFNGHVHDGIIFYRGHCVHRTHVSFEPRRDRPCITRVDILEQSLKHGDLVVEIHFESPFPLSPPITGVAVNSSMGVPVFGSNPRFHHESYNERSLQRGVIRLTASGLPLSSGNYRISVWLGDWQMDYDEKLDVLSFDFRSPDANGLRPGSEIIGHLDWPVVWEITDRPTAD